MSVKPTMDRLRVAEALDRLIQHVRLSEIWLAAAMDASDTATDDNLRRISALHTRAAYRLRKLILNA